MYCFAFLGDLSQKNVCLMDLGKGGETSHLCKLTNGLSVLQYSSSFPPWLWQVTMRTRFSFGTEDKLQLWHLSPVLWNILKSCWMKRHRQVLLCYAMLKTHLCIMHRCQFKLLHDTRVTRCQTHAFNHCAALTLDAQVKKHYSPTGLKG